MITIIAFVFPTGATPAFAASPEDLYRYSAGWHEVAGATNADLNLDPADPLINADDLLLHLAGTPVSGPTATPTETPTPTPTATVTPTPTPPLAFLTGDSVIVSGEDPNVDGFEDDQYGLTLQDGDDLRYYLLSFRNGAVTGRKGPKVEDADDGDVLVDGDERLYTALDFEGGQSEGVYVLKYDDEEGEEPLWSQYVSGGFSSGDPSLAADSNNRVLIVYEGQPSRNDAIVARAYSQAGVPLTNNITLSEEDPTQADIACNQDDEFLAAWVDDGGEDVRCMFLRFSGTSLLGGDQFKLDLSNTGDRYNPRAAALDDGDDAGGFVVVWWDTRDGAGGDIYARTFERDGNDVDFLSDEFRVDAGTAGARFPVAACLGGDTILIAWSDSRDGDYNVYGAIYDRLGQRLSDDFRLDDPAEDRGEVRILALANQRTSGREFGDEALLAWDEAGTIVAKVLGLR